MDFQLSTQPIDLAACRAACQGSASGGFVAFEGWVRDINEGRSVRSLEYQAYPELCGPQAQAIFAEARQRYPIEAAVAVHRVGHLAVGDIAVYVGVATRHRAAAFEACRYLIDNIKHRIPIWKKEHYADGDSEWVDPTRCQCADPKHLHG